MRLLLIRHGQTPANVLGQLDTGEPGPGLTERGDRQAAAIPHALHAERIEAVYVSTLVRTHRTAAPLVAALGITPKVRAGLREIGAGALEMRDNHASHRVYLETSFSWAAGTPDARIPGGENGVEFLARYDEVVGEIAASGAGTVAIVSHGAAIRVWVASRVSGVDERYASSHMLENTAMIAIEGDPESGWRLASWGRDPLGGHMLDDPTADDPTGEPL